MRVLHCSFRYFPDRGGSETYVSSLLHELTEHGVENIVASAGEPAAQFTYNHVPVYRLGDVSSSGSRFGQDKSPGYVLQLRKLVDELLPDVLHLHFHPGMIGRDFVEGWKPGCPMVLTFHHPAISCLRGDLIRFGVDLCSGVFETHLCHPCHIHRLGAPKGLATALACVPEALSNGIANILPQGRLKTALDLKRVVAERILYNHAFLSVFDRIFVLSEWTRSMLLACGLPADRLVLSRLGTHHASPVISSDNCSKNVGDTIKGIFVGRLDLTKGVLILAQAMSRLPSLPLEVDVYGSLENADPRLAPFIDAAGKQCGTLRFRGLLKDDDVVKTMRNYDFAIVCSQSFETGPYTVIEALQAGLPVLGTDIGGINEMVVHDHNGWLVPFASVEGWMDALRKVVKEPETLFRWSKEAKWLRSMNDVAQEVLNVYFNVKYSYDLKSRDDLK